MADKITPKVLTSGFASIAALNKNFSDIATELNNKVLYRDTPEPNQMEVDLDMNSNRILNLSAPQNVNEAARLKDVQEGVTTTATVLPSPVSSAGKYLGASGSSFVFQDTSNLDWKQSGTGAVIRKVESKLQDFVSLSDFGDPLLTTTIDAALLAHDHVIFPAGIYPPYTFFQNNKTIVFLQGVIFKQPDGRIGAADTIPLPTVEVTGTDITLDGNFLVDGNVANNSFASINTSLLIGQVHLAGLRTRINNTVRIINANWVSFSTGSEADQATNIFINHISIENSHHYGTSFWGITNGTVNAIDVLKGPDTADSRVRTGAGTQSVKICDGLTIGSIISDDSVVFEARTRNCNFGHLEADVWKIEDAENVTIGNTRSTPAPGGGFGAGVLTCKNINIGNISVVGHDSSTDAVVRFSEVENVQVNSVTVTGTINDATDLNIRQADGLTIGNIILREPVGNGLGLHFDFDVGFAPQEKIRIGNVISTGHVADDVLIENVSSSVIDIQSVNKDATGNNAKFFIIDEGTFTAAFVSAGGSVTIDPTFDKLSFKIRHGVVNVMGQIKVLSVSAPTGGLTITGLPFTNSNNVGNASVASAVVRVQGANSFSGQFNGFVNENQNVILLSGTDGSGGFDVANLMKTGVFLSVNVTYLV